MKAKRETSADRVFHIFCYLFLLLILVIIIIPLANLLAISFSSSSPVMKGEIRLLPQGFHTSAYQLVFSSGLFYTALGNTAFVTVMGTLLSVATSVLTAYALSIRKLPGRRADVYKRQGEGFSPSPVPHTRGSSCPMAELPHRHVSS